MKLYISEVREGVTWRPWFFWVGSLKLALSNHPECRIRRVISREEADQLATLVTRWGSELGGLWNLDTFEWEWPPAQMA